MSFINSLFKGGDLVNAVGKSLDNLFTSDEERLELKHELYKAGREYDYKESKLIAEQNIAQTEVNREEARNGSLFVAGWRPAVGWIGVLALAYQFIIYPALLWLDTENPPQPMESEILYTIITGMLGIAGLRSVDKIKKTDTRVVKAS